MIGGTDLRDIIHFLGAKLYFHVASCAVIIKSNVQRTISVWGRACDVVPVIRAHGVGKKRGTACADSAGRFHGKATLFQKFRQDIGNLINMIDLLCFAVFRARQMAAGHRDHDPVCDQIAETVEPVFQL